MPSSRVGWQPSRFLTDRGEAERAFALAEQLGSVNAAAAELGTTWPSLRKAFTRRGLGMPARNPGAVRQRAIAAADTRRPGPRDALPLDPVFVALNPGQLPAARRPKAEQGVRLRRGEEIETLSYRTVVELNAESRLAPERRVAAIARPERAQRLANERIGRADRRQAERAARSQRPSRPQPQLEERRMLADYRRRPGRARPHHPDPPGGRGGAGAGPGPNRPSRRRDPASVDSGAGGRHPSIRSAAVASSPAPALRAACFGA